MGKGDSLLSYVPGFLFNQLAKLGGDPITAPMVYPWPSVALFADVSGFTKLCETLAQKENGADELSKHLNNYLAQMVKRIAKNGGDICKFAGDAIIVIWPLEESMDVRCLRAAQSALEIHECLDQLVMGDGISLRVKIGIGVGNLDIVHIGGEADSSVSQRMEYVALGEALVQSFHAENHSQPALTIVSNSVVKLLADTCAYADIEEGGKCTLAYCNGSKPGVRLSTSKDVKWPCKFKKLEKILNPVRSKTLVPNALRMQELSMNTGMNTNIWKYIALSVAPFLDEEHETWGNELRRVSTVFMNLGISMEYLNSSSSINKEACNKLQNVFATVQKEIFDKEGTINKFLVDDKGSTLVAAFGLPPLAHENDAIRAVLASLALFSDVKAKFKLKLSIGITTSMVFTGVVGHRGHRREYSLLGDGVNLAARFMQEANKKHVGILVCHNTKLSCGSSIKFSFPNEITVKGKSVMTPVYQPLSPTEMLSQMNVKVSRSQFYSLRQLKVRQSKLLSEIQSISQTNLLATVPSKGGADGTSPAEVTPSSAPSLRGAHTSTLVYDEDARMWKEISEPLDMVQLKTMNRGAFADGTSERRAEQDKAKKNFMVGEKANLLAKGIERRRSSLLSIYPEELHSEVMRRSSDSFRTSSEDDQRHSTDSEAYSKERDLLFDEDRDFSKSRLESTNRAKFSFQKANSIYSSKSGSATDAFANVANKKIVALHIQYRSRTGDVTEVTIPVLDDNQTIEDVRKKALLYLQRKGFPGLTETSNFVLCMDDEWPLNDNTTLEKIWNLSLEHNAILNLILKEGTLEEAEMEERLFSSALSLPDRIQKVRQMFLCNSQGACIVLEGGIGTGKTYLLEKEFIRSKDTIVCDVAVARGNPFMKGGAETPYHVWKIIITALIENDFTRGHCASSKTISEAIEERVLAFAEYYNGVTDSVGHKSATVGNKQKAFRSIIRGINVGLGSRVLARMPFLLRLLIHDNSDGISSEEYMALIKENHTDIVHFIIVLLAAFASEGHVICAIDDLQYVDTYSWDVIVGLVEARVPLLLALAVRPFGFYVGGMKEPPQYQELLEKLQVSKIDMQPIPAAESEAIACEALKIDVLDAKVKTMILTKTSGNPLFVKEFCDSLKEQGMIEVMINEDHLKEAMMKSSQTKKQKFKSGGKDHKHYEEELKRIEGVIERVVPGTVQCIIASCVDRLSIYQRILLKVAAVLGERFTLTELDHCSLEIGMNEKDIEKEVNDLILKGVIRYLPVDGSNGVAKKDTYCFSQPFMREALNICTLRYQKALIIKAITAFHEQEEVERIRDFEKMRKFNGQATIDCFKEGILKIRKGQNYFFSVWKTRKASLHRDKLTITKVGESEVVGSVSLNAAKCYLASDEDCKLYKVKEGILFCLESSSWSKKGVQSNFLRTFLYVANDVNEAKDWVNKIHMRIVNLRGSVQKMLKTPRNFIVPEILPASPTKRLTRSYTFSSGGGGGGDIMTPERDENRKRLAISPQSVSSPDGLSSTFLRRTMSTMSPERSIGNTAPRKSPNGTSPRSGGGGSLYNSSQKGVARGKFDHLLGSDERLFKALDKLEPVADDSEDVSGVNRRVSLHGLDVLTKALWSEATVVDNIEFLVTETPLSPSGGTESRKNSSYSDGVRKRSLTDPGTVSPKRNSEVAVYSGGDGAAPSGRDIGSQPLSVRQAEISDLGKKMLMSFGGGGGGGSKKL